MKMKKSIALILALSMCPATGLSLASCGEEGNALRLDVVGMDGGVGIDWLTNMEEDFESMFKDKQYGDKTGIDLKVSKKQQMNNVNMAAEAYEIYFSERADVQGFAKLGILLDITDIVTEEDENGRSIASVLPKEAASRFVGTDGKYYGLPHYEFYAGLSYDADTFANYNAYFAAPLTDGNDEQWVKEYKSNYGNALFINNIAAVKSCGPDGEYETYDDGLPTSLQELIILCSYLKDNGVAPLVLSGMYKNMSNYLIDGLWPALAGYEAMSALYNFEGTIEAIKLDSNGDYIFTNELLFEGVEGIYKPETEMVEITQANGYRVSDMVEKYWAYAFLEAAMQENFFCTDSLATSVSHTGAQGSVIFGSNTSGQSDKGMLIDGSYWWNESKLANNFFYYEMATGDTNERQIRYMSMPTSLNTTTTEGNGEPVTLLDVGHGNMYVNANIKDDSAMVEAIKDFLQYAYSDEMLRAFTVETGTMRPLNYTLTDADKNGLDGYATALLHMREVGNVVAFAGDNDIFRNYSNAFRVNLECTQLAITHNNKTFKGTYDAMAAGATSKIAMETTRIRSSAWGQYYKGN